LHLRAGLDKKKLGENQRFGKRGGGGGLVRIKEKKVRKDRPSFKKKKKGGLKKLLRCETRTADKVTILGENRGNAGNRA